MTGAKKQDLIGTMYTKIADKMMGNEKHNTRKSDLQKRPLRRMVEGQVSI